MVGRAIGDYLDCCIEQPAIPTDAVAIALPVSHFEATFHPSFKIPIIPKPLTLVAVTLCLVYAEAGELSLGPSSWQSA